MLAQSRGVHSLISVAERLMAQTNSQTRPYCRLLIQGLLVAFWLPRLASSPAVWPCGIIILSG